ncbi:alpha/beta fold hydrolase [Actinoplanes sp. NPDC049265]|uniref:alpha/beta fold hydrolase n=1 Tax=Actinoplanes sp. NPDC049265 TaxID=3363902 RepID=UPI003721E38D
MIRVFVAVAAVLLAVPLFFLTLLVSAQTTGNAFLSYAAATLVAVLVAAGLARFGRGRRPLVAGLSLVLPAALSWAWFGAPVAYTPVPDSPAVSFWDLPTGSRIAYERIAGPVTHPEPVLLVHGGPGTPSTGRDVFAERLAAAGFAVYNYQQAGAGQSSRLDPDEYTVARHVADLDAIRQRLGVPKMVLIGSSWGGELISAYLAAHPANAAKVIVASPGAMDGNSFPEGSLTPGGQSDQSDQISAHRRFAATFFLGQVGGLRAARTLMPERTADGLYQQFVRSLKMGAGCGAEGSIDQAAGYGLWVNIATNASAKRSPDPRPALRHNDTPLLVLRAQCDYLRWEVTREYRDTFPHATMLTVAGAGHTVLSDRPAETSAAAIAFLTGKPLPAKPYTAAEAPWS